MRFFVLKQPWLNLIVHKFKAQESRNWSRDCKYRGDVLLASSKVSDRPAAVQGIMTEEQWKMFLSIQADYPTIDFFRPTSTAQCVVKFDSFRNMRQEDESKALVKYVPGLKVFDLSNVRLIQPFHTTGMLGLLGCPEEYERKIIYLPFDGSLF